MIHCCRSVRSSKRPSIRLLAGFALAIALAPAGAVSGQCETDKLFALDSFRTDWLGSSIAIDGDLIVAGTTGDDDACVPKNYDCNSGSAYIFERGAGDSWGLLSKITASDEAFQDNFGDSAVVQGDIVIIGATGDQPAGPFTGSAYVFMRDLGGTDNWGELLKIVASDAESLDHFGEVMVLDGDTLIVGAPGGDDACPTDPFCDSGSAYIFQRNAGGADNWGEITKLTASDASFEDRFGTSVGLSGDTAIVGAHVNDATGFNAGAAYIFDRNEGGADNWGEVKQLLPSDPDPSGWFGWSVAIHGDTAVVGASKHGAPGAAYVFQRDVGGVNNWGEVAKLVPSDGQSGDHFGHSIGIDTDTVIVGAHRDDDACVPFNVQCDSGTVFLYLRDEGGPDNWGEVTKLVSADNVEDDRFGREIAIDGDTVIVGVRWADTFELDEGAVYVFDVPNCLPQAQNVLPASFQTVFGVLRGGTVDDLHASDNAYVQIEQRPATTPLLPLIRMETLGNSPGGAFATLTVTIETRSNALPGSPPQRISMFDYDGGVWEIVDERLATTSDSVIELTFSTDPQRFVEAGTNELQVRIDYFDPGNVIVPLWRVFIDEATWLMLP